MMIAYPRREDQQNYYIYIYINRQLVTLLLARQWARGEP